MARLRTQRHIFAQRDVPSCDDVLCGPVIAHLLRGAKQTIFEA